MGRLWSALRWLGVKRVIASTVLGVALPLLFAAWVASSPRIDFGLTHFDQKNYYITDNMVGLNRRSPVNQMLTVFNYFEGDRLSTEKAVSVFSESHQVDLEDVPMDIPDYTGQWHREMHGWPAHVLVRTITMPFEGDSIYTSTIRLPAGWWNHLVGTGHIPLRASPTGLALNWLLFAPLIYLVLSIPVVVRHTVRSSRGHCTRCGYDLEGLASCPECGNDRP